jgi:hypothetical protein
MPSTLHRGRSTEGRRQVRHWFSTAASTSPHRCGPYAPGTFRATLDRWTGLRGTIRFDGDGLVATERSRHVRFARVPGTPARL